MKNNKYIILAILIGFILPISDIDPKAESIYTKFYIFILGCVITYMLFNLYKNKDIL